MSDNVKYVTLRDPITNEILVPRMVGSLGYEVIEGETIPPFAMKNDADTLQGHPAEYFAKAGDMGKLDGAMLYSTVEKNIYASEYVQVDNSVLNALGSGRAFKTLPAINQETGEFYTTNGYYACTGGSYGDTGSKATSYDTSWAYIKKSDNYCYFVPDDDKTICYYGWSVGTSGSSYYFSSDTAHKKYSINISGTTTVGEVRDINGNLIEIGTKIETGRYMGTGTYGSSNPNSLTFGFEPKAVILDGGDSISYPGQGGLVWIYGSRFQYSGADGKPVNFTWVGSTLSWYCGDGAQYQLNASGVTYRYVAIG